MTPERLREIEWAATFVLSNPPVRCRCSGACPRCRERREQAAKLEPGTVLELVSALRVSEARADRAEANCADFSADLHDPKRGPGSW